MVEFISIKLVDGVRVGVVKPKVALAVNFQMHYRYSAGDQPQHIRTAAAFLDFSCANGREQSANLLDDFHALATSKEAVARRLEHA